MAYVRQNYLAGYWVDPDSPTTMHTKRVLWEDAIKMNSDLKLVRIVSCHDMNPDVFDNGPPSNPQLQDQWIVGTNPSGAWVGQEDKKATYVGTGSGWTFALPDPPTELEYANNESFSASFGKAPEDTMTIREVWSSGGGGAKQHSMTKSRIQRLNKTLPTKLAQVGGVGEAQWFVYEEGSGTTYDTKLTAARQIDPMDIPLS